MSLSETSLYEVAVVLLGRFNVRWKNAGDGASTCTCCGALRYDDYDEDRHTHTQEPCSSSCPWRRLQEAVDTLRVLIKMPWTYHSLTVSGNLHEAVTYVNAHGPEWDVVEMKYGDGYTIIVYRLPKGE